MCNCLLTQHRPVDQSRQWHYYAHTTRMENIRQHLSEKVRVWRDRTGKRWLRECTQSQTTWYHLRVACYGQRNRMGKRVERLDTEIDERGMRRERKKEAKAGSKANAESIREGRRKSEQQSFSSRQRTPSDSNMKVTALAALQLLLLPAVSVCFSSDSPKASLGRAVVGGHHLGPSVPTVKWPPRQTSGLRHYQGGGDHPMAALLDFDFII